MSVVVDHTDLVYNPFLYSIQEDPYPLYQRLRDEAPVYHNAELNFYAFSRYDDVLAGFLDSATYSNRKGITLEPRSLPGALLNLDGLEHALHRKTVSRVVTQRFINGLEPFIRRRAREALENPPAHDGFDVIQDYTVAVPLSVINELLGVPVERREPMLAIANRMLASNDDDHTVPEDALAAQAEFRGLVLDLMAEKRAAPADDLISRMVTTDIVDDDGNVVVADEIETAHRILELAIGGYETLVRTLGNGLLALHRDRTQRAALLADLAIIPNVFEEILRWDGAIQYVGRWTEREVRIHDVVIPADSRVLLLMAAANRDERAWPDPDRFDVHRVIDRHVSFGWGPHMCVGMQLARLQARVMLEELFGHFPDHAIDESGLVRSYTTNFRGYEHMPLVFKP